MSASEASGAAAPAPSNPPTPNRSRLTFQPPEPDTPAGRILALGLVVAAVFALLLVAVNTPLADQAPVWVPLVLVLATIVSFTLGVLLGADRGRHRLLELELARTIAVHSGAGQLPASDSALGKVLQEFVRAADEERRQTRVHAYAAGPAAWGAGFALVAAVLWGLSFSTMSPWIAYVAIVLELPSLTLLTISVSILALAVGWEKDVPGFEVLTPRRWRSYGEQPAGIEQTVAELPWLADFAQSLRDSEVPAPGRRPSGPWAESTPTV